jgi:two-component system response regulator AlgR
VENAVSRLRVLIADDEELARLRMRSLLADCAAPAAEVVAEAASGPEALHQLSTTPVDLVLLDIRMPGLDGLQLAERLRRLPDPPRVVFVTAHAEHALQAFDIDAVDYLTKPVRRARLQEALVRVAQRLGTPVAAPATTGAVEPQVLVVSDRGRVQRIPVADVLYLKAELKYVTLRTADHQYVLDDSLAELEQRLGSAVLRVHRNALVARAAVRALERRAMDLPDGDAEGESWAVQVAPTNEWLAVSRRQLTQVRELLAKGGV